MIHTPLAGLKVDQRVRFLDAVFAPALFINVELRRLAY
jgi:hypothetical protein